MHVVIETHVIEKRTTVKTMAIDNCCGWCKRIENCI